MAEGKKKIDALLVKSKSKKKWKDLMVFAKKEYSTENMVFLEQAATIRKTRKGFEVFHAKLGDINLSASEIKALNNAKKDLDWWMDAKKSKVSGYKPALKKAQDDYMKAFDKPETTVTSLVKTDTLKRFLAQFVPDFQIK